MSWGCFLDYGYRGFGSWLMGLGAIAPLLTRDTATGRVKAVNGLLEWLIDLKDVDEVLRDAATHCLDLG